MNDYSISFERSEYESDEARTKNVKGRYSRRNYFSNQQFSSIEKFKGALNAGIQLWDVPCIRDFYTEDNDTDEDSDSEEEQKGDLDNLNAMLSDRKATMKDLKKGFVFFMDQECVKLIQRDKILVEPFVATVEQACEEHGVLHDQLCFQEG